MQIRRYSPFLESAFLDRNGAFVSGEWHAVPDIWRSSAERYGDRIALTDPYHDPPSSMTYKQVSFLSAFNSPLHICFITTIFSFFFFKCCIPLPPYSSV